VPTTVALVPADAKHLPVFGGRTFVPFRRESRFLDYLLNCLMR